MEPASMSNTLFGLNPDLRRLRDDGFDLGLSASNNHLLVRGVPYVAPCKEVKRGTLIAALNFSGDILGPPPDHVIHFIGDQPCEMDGTVIAGILNPSGPTDLDKGLRSDRTFSARPERPFESYHEKITAYVTILESRAKAIDSRVDARSFPVYEMQPNES